MERTNDDQIHIIIRNASGRHSDFEIMMEKESKVSDLKKKLFEKYPENPLPENQRLVCKGKLLDGNLALKNIFDSKGSHIVHIVCKSVTTSTTQNEVQNPFATHEIPPQQHQIPQIQPLNQIPQHQQQQIPQNPPLIQIPQQLPQNLQQQQQVQQLFNDPLFQNGLRQRGIDPQLQQAIVANTFMQLQRLQQQQLQQQQQQMQQQQQQQEQHPERNLSNQLSLILRLAFFCVHYGKRQKHNRYLCNGFWSICHIFTSNRKIGFSKRRTK